MTLHADDAFVQRLCERAATLDERFSEAYEPACAGNADADKAERALARWCALSSGGDWTLFGRRLERDGLSRAEVMPLLGNVRLAPNEERAPWIVIATRTFATLRRAANSEYVAGLRDVGDQLPFDILLAGIVEEAEGRIRGSDPAAFGRLTNSAVRRLALELARSVTDLCAPALYDEFRRWTKNNPLSAIPDKSGDRSYLAFVEYMRVDGFSALFAAKPVLLRLLATLVQQWTESSAEFVSRLQSDQLDLSLMLGAPTPLVAEDIRIVGDLHNRGRAVRLVTFIGGAKVLYKPKDLTIDEVWSNLISKFNRANAPFTLRVPRAHGRAEYGWVEFIEHSACTTSDGFNDYFRKAGAWLCLFHLFSGMDMHEQNIVACGDDPVPIDLETLLQPSQVPEVRESDPRRAYTLAGAAVAESVLSTGLLPAYGRSRRDKAVTHGGLMDVRGRIRRVNWIDANTDRMRPRVSWETEEPNKNLPHANGVRADIMRFAEAVVEGYARYASFVHRYVQSHGVDTILRPLKGVRVRKLIKNTRFYALLIDRLRDHQKMTDGVTWSAQLDFVSRFIDWNDPHDPWWPLAKAERTALAELNIPCFFMETDSNVIWDIDGDRASSGLEPGILRTARLLRTLDDTVIARQCEIIALSLTSVRNVEASLAIRLERRARRSAHAGRSLDRAQMAARANELADDVAGLAFRAPASAAWLGLDWLEDSTVCQLSPLGADLYNGSVGVCLFLAANAVTNKNPVSAKLAIHGVAAVREDLLGANAARSVRALGIGGINGLGSVIFGLTAIAELLGDQRLLADTVSISELLSPDTIEGANASDVMEGVSGAALALLNLHRATGSEAVLDRARLCGLQLLSRRAPESATGPDGTMKTGFSHGSAGIALALVALASKSAGELAERLLAGATVWIDCENTTFCESRGNWPDSRALTPSEQSFWPCQWCHGAAGIGLARIHASRWLAHLPAQAELGDVIDRDIKRAIECVRRAWPYATDSLCCGSLGGIELLTEAGRHLGDRALAKLATRRLSEITTEANQEGDFLWDIADRRVNIGLFRGVSGVGYSLLRQVEPRLPNALVLA